MKRPTHPPLDQTTHLRSVIRRLTPLGALGDEVHRVMAAMGQGYDEIAAHYGFACQGCDESCCRTVFYHHTYAEFLLLDQGLRSLAEDQRQGVYERAAQVQARLAKRPADGGAGAPRAMCPLNRAGRCMLYAFRPMICRLHGIPHTLGRPDGRTIGGPGCHRFEARWGGRVSRRLDRTPHYQRLARLEQALRRRIEAPIRLNMTLAEWLLARAGLATGEPSPASFSPQP